MKPKTEMWDRIATSFRSQSFMATLGARLVSVGEGEVQITLDRSEELLQQHGYVHAGAIASVVDSACGYAALTTVEAGLEVVTAEFKINLLRPAMGESFLATGRVLASGRRLIVCAGEVRADSGSESKLVAAVQATVVSVPIDR